MTKTALVTGVFGQDGSYLARLLLKKKYKVVGTYNKSKNLNWRLKRLKIQDKIILKKLNLQSENNINKILRGNKFNEIYNLAGQSVVNGSIKDTINSCNNTALGVVRLLEGLRKFNNNARFYQASSAEMFGNSGKKYQNEKTTFSPRNPYAISKLFGHHICKYYREHYKLYAVSGILYNHESPLRSEEFVTRKIIKNLVKISKGENIKLQLGNIYTKRDWGYAEEYVEAMWKMLQVKKPQDFIIASGKENTVKKLIDIAIKVLNIDAKWVGKGINEKLIFRSSDKIIIEINSKFIRKRENNLLIGDTSKANKILKWRSKINLEKLVKIMIKEEIKIYKVK